MTTRTLFIPLRVLRRKLKREGVKAVTEGATARSGDVLTVPVETYERAARDWPLRPPETVPPEYDPAKHKDVGRCCS